MALSNAIAKTIITDLKHLPQEIADEFELEEKRVQLFLDSYLADMLGTKSGAKPSTLVNGAGKCNKCARICSLNRDICCHCADKRKNFRDTPVYIDGHGDTQAHSRTTHYCPQCQM